MTHKHEQGELLSEFFVAKINSDQTEGRGHMIDYGVFTDRLSAFDKVKGEAVMGVGDGDIYIRTYHRCRYATCPEIVQTDTQIYEGSAWGKKNLCGEGKYSDFMPDGWRADYSPMKQDPQFIEYLRLKEIYEK